MEQAQDAKAEQLADAISSGDRRAASRFISRIENNDQDTIPVLRKLYFRGGHAQVLGITGPPGAGKSTLVNRLISAYRAQNLTVAVVAVDPSSPFSGGAILGDRVRMNEHTLDNGVFIRSMAARGHFGGLAKATGDVIVLLDAMAWDVIIVETVGVGQSEVDIVRHADTVLLLQPPGLGDDVQAIKAGIMEIADIYVVNKADQGDAEKTVATLTALLHSHIAPDIWQPEVLKTQASNGEGIHQLIELIRKHKAFLAEHPFQAAEILKKKMRYRVLDILYHEAVRQVFSPEQRSSLEQKLDAMVSRKIDPYTFAAEFVSTPYQ